MPGQGLAQSAVSWQAAMTSGDASSASEDSPSSALEDLLSSASSAIVPPALSPVCWVKLASFQIAFAVLALTLHVQPGSLVGRLWVQRLPLKLDLDAALMQRVMLVRCHMRPQDPRRPRLTRHFVPAKEKNHGSLRDRRGGGPKPRAGDTARSRKPR